MGHPGGGQADGGPTGADLNDQTSGRGRTNTTKTMERFEDTR